MIPKRAHRVCRCGICGVIRKCVQHADGTWAQCKLCDEPLKPVEAREARRRARAKAELLELAGKIP